MNEKEYDDLYNEGAEGFNPYRKYTDDEPMWSKVEGRIAKIQRLLNGIGDDTFDAARKARLVAEKTTLDALYETINPFKK
ncbi:MAG: hypothetical protein ABFD66_02055 [Smithella sp.]